jgi:hypothetical protein
MRFPLCLALVFSVLANGFAAEAVALPKMRWDGHHGAAKQADCKA